MHYFHLAREVRACNVMSLELGWIVKYSLILLWKLLGAYGSLESCCHCQLYIVSYSWESGKLFFHIHLNFLIYTNVIRGELFKSKQSAQLNIRTRISIIVSCIFSAPVHDFCRKHILWRLQVVNYFFNSTAVYQSFSYTLELVICMCICPCDLHSTYLVLFFLWSYLRRRSLVIFGVFIYFIKSYIFPLTPFFFGNF